MFERFTKDARAVVTEAVAHSERAGAAAVDETHLLLALLDRQGSRGSFALMSLGLPARRTSVEEALAEARRRGGLSRADADALSGLGIDLSGIVSRVEEAHGEGALNPGRRRGQLGSAAEVASQMATPILDDLGLESGSRVLAFVNGLGGTPAIELYVLYGELSKLLADRGIEVGRSLVGSYITSLEMAGASFTLLELDSELEALWDAPVHTPALRWGV